MSRHARKLHLSDRERVTNGNSIAGIQSRLLKETSGAATAETVSIFLKRSAIALLKCFVRNHFPPRHPPLPNTKARRAAHCARLVVAKRSHLSRDRKDIEPGSTLHGNYRRGRATCAHASCFSAARPPRGLSFVLVITGKGKMGSRIRAGCYSAMGAAMACSPPEFRTLV